MVRHRRSVFDMGDLKGVGTFAILVIIVIVIVMFLQFYGPQFGFTSAMVRSLFNVMPFFFALMISIFFLTRSSDNPLFVVGAFGGIGVSIAFLLMGLHNEGYLTDAMIGGGATVEIAMFWVVIVCLVLGAAVGTALMKRR